MLGSVQIRTEESRKPSALSTPGTRCAPRSRCSLWCLRRPGSPRAPRPFSPPGLSRSTGRNGPTGQFLSEHRRMLGNSVFEHPLGARGAPSGLVRETPAAFLVIAGNRRFPACSQNAKRSDDITKDDLRSSFERHRRRGNEVSEPPAFFIDVFKEWFPQHRARKPDVVRKTARRAVFRHHERASLSRTTEKGRCE